MHIYMYVCMYACLYIYIHTHKHTNTHTHTHTHTHKSRIILLLIIMSLARGAILLRHALVLRPHTPYRTDEHLSFITHRLILRKITVHRDRISSLVWNVCIIGARGPQSEICFRRNACTLIVCMLFICLNSNSMCVAYTLVS